MEGFPLPRPTTTAEPQPPADLGDGIVLTYRCAPEVAAEVEPVITRYRRYREAGKVADGLPTNVGFSTWRLRQEGPGRYALTTSDYAAQDLIDETTDDLTLALWIERSQADTVRRAGVAAQSIGMAAGVFFTKAARSVVEKGRPDELVLVRRAPSSEDDSGWLVRTREASLLGRKEIEILAGFVVEKAPYLLPMLALPTGTVARVAEGRFLGAWQTRAADGTVAETDHQLLDAHGCGVGTPERVGAAERVTIEQVVRGVTVRARVAPQLAGFARATIARFDDAEVVRPELHMVARYAPFVLAGEDGGPLRVTTPGLASREAYAAGLTDDLTAAVWADAAQVMTARRAGLEPQWTFAGSTIAVQAAALRAIVDGQPAAFIMERLGHEPGTEVLEDGRQRSGWMITTPTASSEDERALLDVSAGELQAADPLFTPYLALPQGTLLRFAGGRLHSAHLLDEAELQRVLASGEMSTLGEVLDSGEASRELDLA